MRELHGWHERGGHARRARDAHAPADGHAARVHDGPGRAAHDSLKLRMLLDPEARKAARLDYQKKVDAAQAEYAARHAVGGARPPERRPERTPPETRDRPAGKIDQRTKELDGQQEDRRTPERSRLPRNDTAQMVAGYGIAIAAVADAVNILPGKWDAVLTGFVGAAVATVAWANRRWKEKHGHRPED